MNCEEAKDLIHPLIDGELDASHAGKVEAHIAQCAGCTSELAAFRSLQAGMAAPSLRYRAPGSLRQKIERALPRPAARASRRDLLRGFLSGAGLSAVAASAAFVMLAGSDAGQAILGEVVSAHIRSLEPDHLTDVLSSDRHTVKPWFNGRIDTAPPVIDLAAQGFTLIGGRLDAIGGKTAAAIVYRRRAHIINLFVVAAPAKQRPPAMATLQGFNIRHWSHQGLSLWAVSDMNAAELQEFAEKFEAALRMGT
jgi:anti-sigma factor RsiW